MIGVLAMAMTLVGLTPDPGPIGLWKTPEDGGSLVRIEPCGAALCGHIVSSSRLRADPDQRDVRNHQPDLRTRRLRDLMILRTRPIGPNRWGDGWVYNPEDGAIYKGTIELKADGTLNLTGCVIAPLCRRETWERAPAN